MTTDAALARLLNGKTYPVFFGERVTGAAITPSSITSTGVITGLRFVATAASGADGLVLESGARLCMSGSACGARLNYDGAFIVSNGAMSVSGILQATGQLRPLLSLVNSGTSADCSGNTGAVCVNDAQGLVIANGSGSTVASISGGGAATLASGGVTSTWSVQGNLVAETNLVLESGAEVTYAGKCDSTGSPGNASCNQAAGRAAIAGAASAVTITNSFATTASIITANLQTTDGTCTSIKSIVPGSGSFVVNTNAACTGTTNFGWVLNN